jgi:hypothetical protein
LKIESGETGILTLTNAVYGHASIPVNVVLTKMGEGSYDFIGTANIDGTTKAAAATDLGLTVNVKGNVTKAGKLTVNVTTAGWGTISGVYSGDSLKATVNGEASNKYPVKVTATSDTKATLLFTKIAGVANDFTVEVTIAKEGEGYKLTGTAEKEAGYNVNVAGTVIKNVLTVDVTTSGYATFNRNYTGSSLGLTYNGVAVDMNTSTSLIGVKFTAENALDLSITGVVPALFNAEKGELYLTAKGVKAQKASDSESYTFSGSVNPEGYKASTISFEGTISADKKMTISVKQTIKSDIVGKWNMAKSNGMGKVFFDYQSAANNVVIPDALYQLIPDNMKPQIPAKMDDATFTQIIKQLLGQYSIFLKSIEFAASGDISVVYTTMGDASGKEQTLSGYMNYVVNDKDKLIVSPNLAKLIGMLMPASANSAKSTKAYDPYDPQYILMGEGLPLNFSVTGSELLVTVDNGVFTGLAGFMEGMLPLLAVFIPDKALVEKINALFPPIKEFIVSSPKLEVGLYLSK